MTRTTALVLVAGLGLCAAPAFAGDKFATGLTLDSKRSATADKVSGAVKSKAQACESRRKVKLLHRQVDQGAKWTVKARLRTDSAGRWSFTPEVNNSGDRFATAGDYHVRVDEVTVGTGAGTITCKEKFSSSLFIG